MAQWNAPTQDAAPAEGTMPIRGASPGSSESLPAHEEASSAPGRPAASGTPGGTGSEQSDGTFTFRRIDPAADRPGGEGTVTIRAVNPADPSGGFITPPPLPPAARPHVPLQPGTAPGGGQESGQYGGPQGPQTAVGPHTMPYVPQQPPAAPGSWNQGPGTEEPVVPWRPPVSDPFLAAAQEQAAARPAPLGKRFAARLIDTVVVGAVTAAVAVPLGSKAVDHVQDKIDAARLSGEQVTVWLIDGTTGTSLAIVLAVLLVGGALYEALPTARWGRTLGKKLVGLQVRDIESHRAPGFATALRRWLVYVVPLLLVVGVAGALWCVFDRPWRQCWHDKAARTFVSA